MQIQRKFRRDRKQKVAFSTVSRWLERVKTEIEESRLNSIVHHNETIYEELRENGIEPHPSGGRPFDAEAGYPPGPPPSLGHFGILRFWPRDAIIVHTVFQNFLAHQTPTHMDIFGGVHNV